MTRARRQHGRLVGVGLLAALVLLLLIVPRLLRGGGHPLAQTASFDLCTRLGADPWRTITDIPVTPRTTGSGPDTDPSCVADQSERSGSAAPRQATVFVVTQARLHRQGGAAANTRRYVETFVAEAQASGWTVETVQGAWRDGRFMSRSSLPAQVQFIAEDGGVAILILADGVERDVLLRFASSVASQLRGQTSE